MSNQNVTIADIDEKITSNYNELVGKISLFADLNSSDSRNDSNRLDLERPVTPIEQEILQIPKNREHFMKLLHRRIKLISEDILPTKIQQNFLAVIDQELCLLWADLINLIDYPLYNEAENNELKRRLFIVIILKCQQIFKHFCEKIIVYRNKDIYSDEANITRLKLQLATHLRQKLHVPTLRRHLYQNLADMEIKENECCTQSPLKSEEDRYYRSIFDKPANTNRNKQQQDSKIETGIITKTVSTVKNVSILSKSEETLKLDNDYKVPTSKELTEAATYQVNPSLKQDLIELMEPRESTEESQKSYLEEIQCKIRILQEKNMQQQQQLHHQQDNKGTNKPSYLQPSTFPITLNGTTFLISDPRPTPRKSDIVFPKKTFGPLWNELTDEIDAEMVKELDRNLHRSEEIKEVYKEMMKTVSHDHLSYTQDDIFELCPQRVYVQDFLSSHTLANIIKDDRVINNSLQKYQESPWAQDNRTEWEKPNYKIIESTEIDLKSYVDMSKSSNLRANIRGSHIGSISSLGHGSTKDVTGESSGGAFSLAPTAEMSSRPLLTSQLNPVKNLYPRRHYLVSPDQFVKGLSKLPRLMQDRLKKLYEEWLDLWKEDLNTDDYEKYLSFQPTDYLSAIFHHFEAEGQDAFDEEDIDPVIQEQLHNKKVREMERLNIINKRVEELEQEKSKFVRGSWNPSIINLGGLGRPPVLSEETVTDLLKEKPSLPDPESHSSKKSAYSRARSAHSGSKPTPMFIHEKNVDEDPVHKTLQMLSSSIQEFSEVQQRLETLWTQLKMPNQQRLDMVIKLSNSKYALSLDPILRQWEAATEVILNRELALLELEKFERTASDPNRYFAKGYLGSSNARMEESETRKNLHQKLEDCTKLAMDAINDIKTICEDDLTFEGRLYIDKIKWDKVEMLYWLQEERKDVSQYVPKKSSLSNLTIN